MSQCKNSKDKQNGRNRQVRLVCVFMIQQIKSKIVNPKEIFADIEAFCLEFSTVSEANALYKEIKKGE